VERVFTVLVSTMRVSKTDGIFTTTTTQPSRQRRSTLLCPFTRRFTRLLSYTRRPPFRLSPSTSSSESCPDLFTKRMFLGGS
jgi:hypothetical protein